VNASGLWNVQIRKSTGVLNDAILTINQPESDSRFSGFWRFTSVQTSNAQVVGDTKTGVFKINEIGGSSYVNFAGIFTQNTYLGTYKAYYSDNTTATGSITMKKAPPTSKLTFNIQPAGHFFATVSISNGKTQVYDGFAANKTVLELPQAKLTITPQDVEPYLAPVAQTVDLTTGDKSITLEYRLKPLRLSAPSTLEVNRNSQTVLKAQILPAPDFKGVVELRLQNLPAGVTATPVSINVSGGTTIEAEIPVFAAADTKFVDAQVPLTAVSGLNSASANLIIQTRPKLTFPVPGNASWELGADGQMYVLLPAEHGVFRVHPDGSRELIVTGDFPCGGLYAAPDGSLWTSHRGFTRIDVNAKTVEILDNPTGGSGCGSLIPDANKNIWDVVGQVVRFDLVSQQKTTVPDSQNLGFMPSKIVNNQLWGASGSNLGMINTTTLEIKKYQVLGAFNINAFYVHDDTVAVSDGAKLFVLNTSTGTVVEHKPEGIAGFMYLMGQEQDGSLWISGGGKWFRYNPTTKQITKELPALSSTKVYVTPTGTLWYITTAGLFFVDP
jgi:hypothetical protein